MGNQWASLVVLIYFLLPVFRVAWHVAAGKTRRRPAEPDPRVNWDKIRAIEIEIWQHPFEHAGAVYSTPKVPPGKSPAPPPPRAEGRRFPAEGSPLNPPRMLTREEADRHREFMAALDCLDDQIRQCVIRREIRHRVGLPPEPSGHDDVLRAKRHQVWQQALDHLAGWL